MKLPIGYDDFREIIDNKLEFIDKTLFIKEVIDDITTKVVLITRPRRFGKTLNLSMLQHFLAAEVGGLKTDNLFQGLKITKIDGGKYLEHQGKYPVISISFKDVKKLNLKDSTVAIRVLIRKQCRQHRYLLTSAKLAQDEQELFRRFMQDIEELNELEDFLQVLSEFLFKHHGVKPWLLIDEYDTPIQASYLNGYYEEMVSFMRNFFSAALKTNPYLERAVITGILRVAKESLFSGLNNIEVYSLLRNEYSQYFGFTEAEVTELFNKSGFSTKLEDVKKWYNGYQFGNSTLYNPWSIANCIKRGGVLGPYWVNTSDNMLVKQLFAKADGETKIDLESLVRDMPIEKVIDEYVAFTDVTQNPNALWSMLLSSGYLKVTSCEPYDDKLKCILMPPNHEVFLVYKRMVKDWFSDKIGNTQYDYFINTLLQGNIEDFYKMLKKYLIETLSFFDATNENPEKFYHGFVVGLISSTLETHNVKSNRESGYGKYDVIIIPKDLNQKKPLGLILEFKVTNEKGCSLQKSAKAALAQINKRDYAAELRQQGIKNIIQVGLAFRGKDVVVVYESLY